MTITDPHAVTTAPAERLIWSFNMLLEVKASAEETNGAFTLLDSWLTPAADPPPHVHLDEDESFYVLEGELGLWADGGEARFGPGSFVAVPPGEEHGILRVEAPVRVLNFHAPDDGVLGRLRSE